MKRPLLSVALCYVGGLLLAAVPVSLVVLFAISFLLVAVAPCWSRARPFVLCALMVLAGWTNLGCRTATLSPNDLRLILGNRTELATVRGILRSTPSQRVRRDVQRNTELWSSSAEIEVVAIRLGHADWRPAFGRIVANTPGVVPETIFGGQSVEVSGVLRPPRGPLAEGLFDYRNYLRQQGIYYQLSVGSTNDWQIIASPRSRPLTDRFSAWARKTLALGLPADDESLQLEWALTLGWKNALTEEASEPFIRAATYHIFAVDGLRIAIISGILLGLFRVSGVPHAICGLATLPFIFFYAAMTGWPASAIRAIVMITVIFCGWALKRPSDFLNNLFAAALIILVWEPRQLFQAGFQLSFFVVLCIILILPFFNRIGERVLRPNPLIPEALQPRWQKILRPPARYFVDLLLTSVAAWLGSIPLVAYYFHIITPLSGPANVFAVPLCALVLVCNLASLLVAVPLPFVAVLFNHAGWFLMNCIRTTSQWSAGWPGAYRYVHTPAPIAIVLYYIILLTVLTGWLFRGNHRKWKIAGLSLFIVVWCVHLVWQSPETRLTILPLNGGHAIFAQTPGPEGDWLIDSGNTNAADGVLKPFIRAQGINRVSNFVLTHGESHFSAGAQVIDDSFQPRNIFIGARNFRSTAYREFLLSNDNGSRQKSLQSGNPAGPWKILYPGPNDHHSRAEDDPLVLRSEFAGTRILLLSDLGHTGQIALLNDATNGDDLRADIVVAGVPPEGEPLADVLLDVIQPRVIIIADSEYPAPRRATDALKQRLAKRNVTVFSTRDSDAITLSFDHHGWQLKGMDGTRIEGTLGLQAR